MRLPVDRISKGAFLSGFILVQLILVGCGSNRTTSGGANPPVADTLAPGGASSVYVVQQAPQGGSVPVSILKFATTSNGSVSPASTLTLPEGFGLLSMSTDSSGHIYVGGAFEPGQNEMLEYAAGATGQAMPIRTILYPYIVFDYMALGSTGDLYVGFISGETAGSISIFPSTASGTVPPQVRQITGPLTQIDDLTGLAVDSAGYIYAANFSLNFTGSILVFAPDATGNAAPVRVITMADFPNGIAVDANGNIFVATTVYPSGPGKILEFGPGATGAAIPIRMIAGSATEMVTNGYVQVDSVGNAYVATETVPQAGSTSGPLLSIVGFGPTADGNIVPALQLSSSSWPSTSEYDLALILH